MLCPAGKGLRVLVADPTVLEQLCGTVRFGLLSEILTFLQRGPVQLGATAAWVSLDWETCQA